MTSQADFDRFVESQRGVRRLVLRDLAAWWQVPAHLCGAMAPSWPLAAFALAYAQHLGDGGIPPGTVMWVEKTLTNELFLERIWRDFPAAKVIHIVRRPEAVLASLDGLSTETVDAASIVFSSGVPGRSDGNGPGAGNASQ